MTEKKKGKKAPPDRVVLPSALSQILKAPGAQDFITKFLAGQAPQASTQKPEFVYVSRESGQPSAARVVDVLFSTDDHIVDESEVEIRNSKIALLVGDGSDKVVKKMVSSVKHMTPDEREVFFEEVIKRWPGIVFRILLGRIIGMR